MFRIKVLIIKNTIKRLLRDHSLLKLIFVGTLSALLLLSTFLLTYKSFCFVRLFPFGGILIQRTLSLFFLTILCMLIFSNLTTSLSTLYTSAERPFLMSLPIPLSSVFSERFIETISLSSWAPLLLVAPILLSWAISTSCDSLVYFIALSAIFFFIIIAGCIGTGLSLILASLFSLKRGYTFGIGLSIFLLPLAIFLIRFGIFRDISDKPFVFFGQMIESMSFAENPFLPSSWLVRTMECARERVYKDSLFFLLMLFANAGFLLTVLHKVADFIYLRGINVTESSSSLSRHRNLIGFGRLFFFLRPQFRALVAKDIAFFLRDPVQWSQFLIFFGIIFVYILNMPRAPFNIETPYWRSLTLFLNISAMGLILSTLTTRFTFPLISLEGKRFWIVGLSPVSRRGIILEKLLISIFLFLLITEGLMVLLNAILNTETLPFFLSVLMIGMMTVSLVSLSVGLGAIYPVFSKENPSAIVSSLGGTINAILSLFYVLFSVIVIAIPVQVYNSGRILLERRTMTSLFLFFAISTLYILIPLWKGVRSLEKIEI
jgi:ABC-2 type transport system permease protein